MLVGSLSVVIYTFIGKNPEEVANLEAKNEALDAKVKALSAENDKLELMLRDIQSEVIDKLAITGEHFDFTYLKKN